MKKAQVRAENKLSLHQYKAWHVTVSRILAIVKDAEMTSATETDWYRPDPYDM